MHIFLNPAYAIQKRLTLLATDRFSMGNMIMDRWMQRTYVILRQPSSSPVLTSLQLPLGESSPPSSTKPNTGFPTVETKGSPRRRLPDRSLLGTGWWARAQASSFRPSLSGHGRLSRAHTRAKVTVRADTHQQEPGRCWGMSSLPSDLPRALSVPSTALQPALHPGSCYHLRYF